MRLGLILLLAAGSAFAQYRDRQPPVLEQAAPADPAPAVLEEFRAAYRAAGAPRMALFWNVSLTDRLREVTTRSLHVRGEQTQSVNRLEQQTSGEAGSSRLVDGEQTRKLDMTVSSATRTSDSAKRGLPLTERDAWLLETAFTQGLIEGGAGLIDRSLIMRLTAAQKEPDPDKEVDTRTIETQALVGKADVLLEILMTPDPESPFGWGFRCTLREIATGRLKGSFYSTAMKEEPTLPVRFVATNRGFEPVSEPASVLIDMIGRQLALEAMDKLKDSLGAGNSKSVTPGR